VSRRCDYGYISHLASLVASGTRGIDVWGWVARVSASNPIRGMSESLTVHLGVLEAVDANC